MESLENEMRFLVELPIPFAGRAQMETTIYGRLIRITVHLRGNYLPYCPMHAI